jgi:hypothetical protein
MSFFPSIVREQDDQEPAYLAERPNPSLRAGQKPAILGVDLSGLRHGWRNVRPRLSVGADSPNCWVISGTPTKKGGYVQVNLGGRKLLAHHVAYVYWYRAYQSDLHISHLCSNMHCCNPAHLHQECKSTNEDRKTCLAKATFTSCPHWPKCIGFKHI